MNTLNKNNPEKKKKLLAVSFIITILYSLHLALPLYSSSTFLIRFIDQKYIGVLYAISALFTLFASFYFSKFLKRFHTYKTSIFIILIGFVATLLLGFVSDPIIISILFFLNFCTNAILFSIINLFVEEFDDVSNAGETRGIFLTLFNLGILIGALFSGQIINNYSFTVLWVVSAICLIPILVLIKNYYKEIPDPKYKKVDLLKAFKNIYNNKNILIIMLAMLVLESFYTVMGIYAPLYLSQTSGVDIITYASIIMPIALIPFIVLPYELGYLADKKYGEKEMLMMGLSVLSFTALAFTFLNTQSIFYITMFLLISRIGATFVESMCYTYFFKKVDSKDMALITIFGNIRTLSIIIAPIFASIILYFNFSINYIFIVLGLFIFYILIQTLKLVDTK
jgi:MFS family permease